MELFKLLSYRIAHLLTVVPILLMASALGGVGMALDGIGDVVQVMWQRVFFEAPKPGQPCPDCGEVHDAPPDDDLGDID